MPNLLVQNVQTKGRGRSTTWQWNSLKNPSNTVTYSLSQPVALMVYRNRSTSNTPGFHSPGRIGPLPMRSFLYESKDMVFGDGNSNYYFNTGIWSSSSGYTYQETDEEGPGRGASPSLSDYYNFPASPLPASRITSLDYQARNKVILNVKDMKVNLAQFIAERQQAIDMFVSNATKLVEAVRSARRGDMVGAAKHLGVHLSKRQKSRMNRRQKSRRRRNADTLGNSWLELQYGWLPLLSDVKGAAETAAKALDDVYRASYRASARAKAEHDQFLVQTRTSLPGGFKTSEVRVQGKHEVSYHLRYGIQSPPSYYATALGLTNPLLLAWEVLPFSFVADWFIGIGDYLSTLDATMGLNFLDGSKTEFWHWTWTGKGVKIGTENGYTYRYDSGNSSVEWVYCKRTVLPNFPNAPPPYWKDDPLNLTRIANAGALLLQFFK